MKKKQNNVYSTNFEIAKEKEKQIKRDRINRIFFCFLNFVLNRHKKQRKKTKYIRLVIVK
jgi:hypothetical protein